MAQKTYPCPACSAAVNVPDGYQAKVVLCQVCGASINPRDGSAVIRNVTPVRAKSRLPIWITLAVVIGGGALTAAYLLRSSGLLTTAAEWVTYADSAGGYGVQFPKAPGDSNAEIVLPDGRSPLNMVAVVVDGVEFQAGWFDHAATEEFGLVQAGAVLAKDFGKIDRQSSILVQRVPGLRIQYSADDTHKTSMLVVRNGNRHYMVAIKEYSPDLQPVADRFLSSFKLVNPVLEEEEKDDGPKRPPLTIEAAAEQIAPAGFEFFEEFKIAGGTGRNVAAGEPLYTVYVDGMLPRGITSHHTASSMQLKGAPLDPGEFKFTVVAEDAAGARVTHTYTMIVEKVKVTASWKSESLGTPMQGREHIGTIELSVVPVTANATWSISAGKLPPGMQVGGDAAGCKLTGAPQEWGVFAFTLTVAIDVTGGDPVTLSREFQLTVLPSEPELSKHVKGSILLVAHQGGFSEGIARKLMDQAAALPDVLAPEQTINVWAFNAEGRRTFLRDDKPVGKDDKSIRAQMRSLGLAEGARTSLVTALQKVAEQELDAYGTIMVLTAWNPESAGEDAVEKVVSELELLASLGTRRVVLAMQSSTNISQQSALPESENLVFLRYVSR
jgi:hypothetical protein